jgi:enoyl-CoA hydratase
MVSKVFPAATLAQRTLELADRVARLPTVTALLIKESVNQSVDNMGFFNALQSCFTLHQLNHSHWAELHDDRVPAGLPEDGIESWRTAAPVSPAIRDQPSARR